jgi:hypothetical protein
VILFVSFFTYLGGLAASVWRAMEGPYRDVAAVIGVSLVMWLLNGVIDNQLVDKYLWIVPGLLIALASVTQAERAPKRVRPAAAGSPSQATPATV